MGATKQPSSVVFLSASGEALPDWLQPALQRQLSRLEREFPAFRGDLAVIQDLLDRVGQRVAEKVAGGLVIENVMAYVDTAAFNAAIDATKYRQDLLQGRSVPVTEQEATSVNGSGPQLVLWRDATEWLNAQEEDILMRYFWYGERHREIAVALGLSQTAVRSRFSRCLDKLRRALAPSKKNRFALEKPANSCSDRTDQQESR